MEFGLQRASDMIDANTSTTGVANGFIATFGRTATVQDIIHAFSLSEATEVWYLQQYVSVDKRLLKTPAGWICR
jgi:hypothetical protein